MEYLISFPDVGTAQKTRLASELSNSLIGVKSIKASPRRQDAEAQDTGTIVAVVLASPVIQELVKALFTWVAKNNAAVIIEMPNKNTKVRISNTDDISKVIQSLKELE